MLFKSVIEFRPLESSTETGAKDPVVLDFNPFITGLWGGQRDL